ncbi:MAG TPA: EF-hand domain-containing protein [Rhizomicrobium sp.]|nr:EF-hand domain-containing protein [Rhizomicrobium sp.]
MKPFVRYALLFGAVVIAGGGVAMATINRSSAPAVTAPQPGQPYAATASTYSRGRSGGKFFAQFDANHDGKVTRDEFNKVLAQEFALAAGSSPAMSQQQYIAFRMKDLRQKTDQMFHRYDWNGDGKLSLEEYAAPERVRFESADSDGTGTILCGSRSRSTPRQSYGYGERGYSAGRSSGGGRGAICKADDLNHDGQVTRAEFDTATAQEFSAAAKGGALTPDQFYGIVAGHVRDSAVKTFARLDRNKDGKLDRDEFAASELRYFARLDRNNDGVITRDETTTRRYGDAGTEKPGRT